MWTSVDEESSGGKPMCKQSAGRVVGVCLCLLLSLAVFLPAALAQETTGGMKGYVKDKTGGSVAGAEVELSSTALLTPRKAEADSAGYFYFQLLPPGEYTLTATGK